MYQETLRKIAKVLIEPTTDFEQLSTAIIQLKEFYLKISEVDLENDKNRKDIHLSNGKALGTSWAARCVDDIIRTKQFISGVYQAVQKLLDEHPEKTIHILYAGTGPFAALVTPLTALFSSNQLQFTFLELNTVSYQKVQLVVQQIGIEAYVRRIIQTDATTYQIPADERVDILLSETMQNALKREQQVPIIYNLLQQIDNEVILIPEVIELQLAGINAARNRDRMMYDSKKPYHQILGSFFKLDIPSVCAFYANHQDLSNTYIFSDQYFNITENLRKDFPELYVFTRLCVYQNIEILPFESGLTIPYKLANLDNQQKESSTIRVAYELGEDPDIRFSFS